MIGILDRFTDNNKAVILIEEIKEELIVSISDLPKGSKENTHFQIEKVGAGFRINSIDHTKTRQEAQKTSDLMKKLRAKSTGSKLKRK
ncbi:hypothetical protein JOC34_001714 [Virgibacillus halotolerans]|uniref:DUF3006 domain-containing protein n=1 Tax=Virgibacillus halotolerans TaxID=1071053 RepID=UPI001961546B|nr:DUF3006 domain-containing protein [Virgibacillus halotolerans]MBM7599346.1 hypothetical protein [Virgibacillus halotolerans]